MDSLGAPVGSDFACGDPRLAQRLFTVDAGHIAIDVRSVTGAQPLWINWRAASHDPMFTTSSFDSEIFCRQITDCCAYYTPVPDSAHGALQHRTISAVADRYGGEGNGSHGGSGRAAIVGGYHVKGIGPTPLIGQGASIYHRDGLASLDECVLEAVYSEVVAHEFPHGAVPTLAIIDTDSTAFVARGNDAAQRQRRGALLVRPCFLRPAHFERAVNYSGDGSYAGLRDSARVRSMFELASATYGIEALREAYEGLWRKWAEQLAYAFVHRLPHGAPSTSNLCLDGRLADFGNTTAVPTWARVVNTFNHTTYGEESKAVIGAIRSVSYFFGRYLDPALAEDDVVAATVERTLLAYEHAIMIEFMRIFGMSRTDACDLMEQEGERVARAIRGIRRHFRHERLDGLGHMPAPKRPCDIERVWTDDVPPHLQPVRELLRRAIAANRQDEAAQVCRFRARPRPALYRQELIDHLGCAMDREGGSPAAISQTIYECVAAGRRDCALEPDRAVPLGFACGPAGNLALFKCLDSGRPFALPEPESRTNSMPGRSEKGAAWRTPAPERRAISTIGTACIEFAAGERFVGSVSVCE